ncbi:hypothetical protein Poly24_26120 [Rosistilla carotiformis]|uniref:Uncharacterized protein n=1 Tax=Rosistilla carotiformis TaxID=2528017 RepID=A0A518JTM4_9BACT|nr:hypothetical protein Poly24_26120 [Rosistilla carotiformis]
MMKNARSLSHRLPANERVNFANSDCRGAHRHFIQPYRHNTGRRIPLMRNDRSPVKPIGATLLLTQTT